MVQKKAIYADVYLRLNKSALTIKNAAHKVDSGRHDKQTQSQDEWLFLAFALLLPLLEIDCWNAFSLIKWTNNNNNSYQLKKTSAQQAGEKESGKKPLEPYSESQKKYGKRKMSKQSGKWWKCSLFNDWTTKNGRTIRLISMWSIRND